MKNKGAARTESRPAGAAERKSRDSSRKPHSAAGQKKKRSSRGINPIMLMIGIFTVSLCAYVFCRFFLRTANTSLSIENQKTNNQIEETSQTIKSLEEDINQLEQKTRVIGILDGQVTDNEDNVIYYDNN